jgi:hypothetical protein
MLPLFLDIIHIVDAIHAHILAPVGYQAKAGTAENTGGLVLLQHDLIVIHINFQLVPFPQIQSAAQLDGKHDSSLLIYLTNNSGGLHSTSLPLSMMEKCIG